MANKVKVKRQREAQNKRVAQERAGRGKRASIEQSRANAAKKREQRKGVG